MRFRQSLIPTLKEVPTDAEVISHQLMVRAGMIRQVARGIYDFLPLGLRVVRKVERIVREEMDRAGAQEILMPAICPAELWQESGRWDRYGKELLRMKDRYDRDFCFGPTHEELVTDIVRREVRSYRDLPLNLYQIQVKFRDEVRPRFGLMRGREFIMKDAYSFHVDADDCWREYENMAKAYRRIFERCGLTTRQVESDTGAIGGSAAHEFQVLADSGEDAIVSCNRCEYAANVERAEVGPIPTTAAPRAGEMRKVRTPGKGKVEAVAEFLSEPPDRFIKTLLYGTSSGTTVAALVRGDHEISDAKLKTALGVEWVALADEDTVRRVSNAPVGFAGPFGLSVQIIADHALRGISGAVTGANEVDHHLVDIDQARDLPALQFADLRAARAGDRCPRCDGGVFEAHRGIEVGNIFYLGTKYSVPMKATYLDAGGQEHPMVMGCYGIGVTRTAAAAIEQHHDANGIIWPLAIAPAHVHVVPVNWNDEALRSAAESLVAQLEHAGIEVLLDDRDERPGVKFKDADLIGIPLRVTVGAKSLARGCVEFKHRRDAHATDVRVDEVVERIATMVRTELAS
ncbi:MAG: proline--tRNA ligase [Deltaproteobacteria bacterium]|nr:proline--tRNA ligase [Deltaproteobacteria bacterium]MBI3387623.1 proline--tRNA ligase [Deltaproteobacteria bacterium]